MPDNLKEIDKYFELRESKDIAGGYSYWCKECDLECNVGEAVFECQCGTILPTYIICRYGCGRRWRLEITPDASAVSH